MNSINQGGQVLSDEQIADNIIGVFFAAQDTTASVMTWIIKYLHNDPKLLEVVKVRRALKTLRSNIICFFVFFSSSDDFKSQPSILLVLELKT